MENYNQYMLECIELAKQALEKGNPPVGSVLVFEDKIIGKGIESGKSSGDITQHAEILAVKDALKNGYRDILEKSVMFTTHEPCIMCSYLIRHHKIAKLVFLEFPFHSLVGSLRSLKFLKRKMFRNGEIDLKLNREFYNTSARC